MKKVRFFFARSLSLWLILCLGFADPASALRGPQSAQTGVEETLTESLRDEIPGPSGLLRVSAGVEEPPFGRWLKADADAEKDAARVFKIIKKTKGISYPKARIKGEREHGTSKALAAIQEGGYYTRFYALGDSDYFVFPKQSDDPDPLIIEAHGTVIRKVPALPSPISPNEKRVDYLFLERQAPSALTTLFQKNRNRLYARLEVFERGFIAGMTQGRALGLASARDPEEAFRLYSAQRAASNASSLVPLTDRRFVMDSQEARQIAFWLMGHGNLESGKEYLAFSRPWIPLNSPRTVLAHVLPQVGQSVAPEFGQAGKSLALTRLSPFNAQTSGTQEAREGALPVLLLRFLEENGKKWIDIYQIPNRDRRLTLGQRVQILDETRNDPTAYTGRVVLNIPYPLGNTALSNKNMEVFSTYDLFWTEVAGFMQEARQSFQAKQPVPERVLTEFPKRIVMPLGRYGLRPLREAMDLAGVKRVVGLMHVLRKDQRQGQWTHLVLRRAVRQRSQYGLTHFLVKGTFARKGVGSEMVESPLEFVAVLASNHPQWTGVSGAFRPLMGAYAFGLIDADEVARSDRLVSVRTIPVDREFLIRRAQSLSPKKPVGTEPPAAFIPGGFDSGVQWIVDFPIKYYSSPTKLGVFRVSPAVTAPSTRWLSTAVGSDLKSLLRPLKFQEDSNGSKWVGLWSPGNFVSVYEPDFWMRISQNDQIKPGVNTVSRNPRGRQLRRFVEETQKYLRGEPAQREQVRAQMKIRPMGLPNLPGTFQAIFIRGGRRKALGHPTIAVLSAAETPEAARGKRFLLVPPATSAVRPYLRAVGDLQDADSGVTVHVWLDDSGKHQVRINQFPSELGMERELAADVLTARGFSLEEARQLTQSLKQNIRLPLSALQLGKAKRVDPIRLNQIPVADWVVASVPPLALIPTAQVGTVQGVLVTPQDAVFLNADRFALYQAISDTVAAGMEEIPSWMAQALNLRGLSKEEVARRLTAVRDPGGLVARLVAYLQKNPDRIPEAWRFASAYQKPKEGSSVVLVGDFEAARAAGPQQVLAHIALQAIQEKRIALTLSKLSKPEVPDQPEVTRRTFIRIGLSMMGALATEGPMGLLATSSSGILSAPSSAGVFLQITSPDARFMLQKLQSIFSEIFSVYRPQFEKMFPSHAKLREPEWNVEEIVSRWRDPEAGFIGKTGIEIAKIVAKKTLSSNKNLTPDEEYPLLLVRDLSVDRMLAQELSSRIAPTHEMLFKNLLSRMREEGLSSITESDIDEAEVSVHIALDRQIWAAVRKVLDSKDPLTESWAKSFLDSLTDRSQPFFEQTIQDALEDIRSMREVYSEPDDFSDQRDERQGRDARMGNSLAVLPVSDYLGKWLAGVVKQGSVKLVADWNQDGDSPFSLLAWPVTSEGEADIVRPVESPTQRGLEGLASLVPEGKRLPPDWVTRVWMEQGISAEDASARLRENLSFGFLARTVSQESEADVLVVEAGVISQRPGLAEFIRRTAHPERFPVVIVGRESLAAEELAGLAGLTIVRDDDYMVELALALSSIEKASRVVYVGDAQQAVLLKRLLPEIFVEEVNPGAGLDKILISVGFSPSIFQGINAVEAEKAFARLYSA